MTATVSVAAVSFPTPLEDAVRHGIRTTFSSICGAEPVLLEGTDFPTLGPAMIGAISFVGDVAWSYSLVFPRETAVLLARQFAGFDIAFDSPDMGDVVGELANVLAGDVVANLEARRIKAQMSLPTITRGSKLEVMVSSGALTGLVNYVSCQGPFSVRLLAARPVRSFVPRGNV
jgi:CheY-specific phosphatase CheX